MDNVLDYQSRGRTYDPPLVLSVRGDFIPRPRPYDLCIGGTLMANHSPTHCFQCIFHLDVHTW